jgi:hypothetical protein
MLIGGLWFPAEKRSLFKSEIRLLRKKFGVFGEIKWNKVSASKLDFYINLVNYFFDKKGDDLRFRCVVVDKDKVNLVKYHESDAELGFYKFYYQLLHHWILDFNTYSIFLDVKTSRVKSRLKVLHRCLSCSNLSSEIKLVQAIPSRESIFIQLTDLLLGAVNAKFNRQISTPVKEKIIETIELRLGHDIQSTYRTERKFNIFVIDLGGERE